MDKKYPEIEKKLKSELDWKIFRILRDGWQYKGTLWTIGEIKKLVKELPDDTIC